MKTLVLPLMIMVTTMACSQNIDMKTELLQKVKNSGRYTEEVLRKMPAEKLAYKPSKETRSFAEIIEHVAEAQLYTASQGIAVEQMKFKGDLSDKEALADFLKRSNARLFSAIESLTIEDLIEHKNLWGEIGTVYKILAFTLDHVTHHRGQATVYLRLNNIKPPEYIGW